MLFSSSVRSDTRQDPTRAIKVLWKNPEEGKVPLSNTSCVALDATLIANSATASFNDQQQQPLKVEELRKAERSLGHCQPGPSRYLGVTDTLACSAVHEEMMLLPAEFCEMRLALERSADYLPETCSKFNGWRVGLLERFRKSDC